MYFSICIGMQFISKLLLFSYGAYLLRNKMGIKTSQIMGNNWDLVLVWVNPQYQITILIRLIGRLINIVPILSLIKCNFQSLHKFETFNYY